MSNSKVSYTAVLQAMSDGLAAYQVYLATCKMHSVRSEYLFYEPIARIAQSYGWRVQCEVDTGQKDNRVKGDKSRVDFVISPPGNGVGSPRLVIEVKYLGKSTKRKTIKSLAGC